MAVPVFVRSLLSRRGTSPNVDCLEVACGCDYGTSDIAIAIDNHKTIPQRCRYCTSNRASCKEGEIQSGDGSHANLQVRLNATSMLGPRLPGVEGTREPRRISNGDGRYDTVSQLHISPSCPVATASSTALSHRFDFVESRQTSSSRPPEKIFLRHATSLPTRTGYQLGYLRDPTGYEQKTWPRDENKVMLTEARRPTQVAPEESSRIRLHRCAVRRCPGTRHRNL